MKNNSLVDVAKHQNKLRKIVALNEAGAIIFTDKTAMALYGKVSKSEFINAFKADVEKTATYLIDSLGIINSIKNGLIQELDSLDNSVESFFGETYKDGVITLSGVEFIPGAKAVVSRSEIIDTIYNKLFEIDRKSLNYLARTLERYETSTSDIEKALLYPSTVMADKLIEKIGLINHKFEEFRGKLSYEELEEFTSTFNRSGITDVIQASTYVDIKGVRQIANSHKSNIPVLSEISESLKASKFKYIQALELDADSDVRKVFNVISQIERLKINIKEKFVLKFRKLGNYNVRGLCINTLGIVAEDVRDSSALIHEIAHYVHLSNMQIFESKFVNYMIDKLTQRVDLNNVPVVAQSNIAKKETYYLSREEVIARALEIAALFANETSRVIWSEADLDLIKSRSFYEEYEGIYFNFNSFDEETKDEMLKLWELFYETSYSEVSNTNIDLFVKIDTKFRRTQKDIHELLKEADRLSTRELKELYSFVNMENIDLIINNKPNTLGIENLALVLFQKISLWSGMNQKMSASDWSDIIENQFAPIFLKLIKAVRQNLDSYQWVEWLNKFKQDIAFKAVDSLLGLNGFNLNFRTKVRSDLEKLPNWLEFKEFRDSLVKFSPISLASKEVLEDLEYVKKFYIDNPQEALRLKKSGLFNEETFMSIYRHMYDCEKTTFIPTDIMEIITVEEKIEINNHMIETSSKSEIETLVEELTVKYKDQLESKKTVEPETTPTNKTVGDKIEEVKHLQKQEFEEIIKSAEIVDFEHTKTGKQLKVLKVKEKIANFKAFNEYLINNGIAYYSKFAQGFIIKNYERVKIASSTALAIYSQDLLETFAKGTLF